jgi:hypothetical protein
MSWWDDVKFVVTGEQSNAVKAPPGQEIRATAGSMVGVAPDANPAPGATSNTVSAGRGSAGEIRMSRDEMEDTLRRARNLLTDISNQITPASFLTRMQPPATDPASVSATNGANNGGSYYVGHLRRQQAYLQVVIDKMQKALGFVVETDEQQGKTIQNTAGGSVA